MIRPPINPKLALITGVCAIIVAIIIIVTIGFLAGFGVGVISQIN